MKISVELLGKETLVKEHFDDFFMDYIKKHDLVVVEQNSNSIKYKLGRFISFVLSNKWDLLSWVTPITISNNVKNTITLKYNIKRITIPWLVLLSPFVIFTIGYKEDFLFALSLLIGIISLNLIVYWFIAYFYLCDVRNQIISSASKKKKASGNLS